MDEHNYNLKKGTIWVVLIWLMVLFVGMQLQGLSLEEHVSPEYVKFYNSLLTLAFVTPVAFFAFKAFGELGIGEAFGLGNTQKLIIFVGFFAAIMFMTVGAGQILPVPKSTVQGFQLTPETEIITSSVIPGILEDVTYLIALPMSFLIVLVLLVRPGESRMMLGVLMVISCIVGSVGYNIWVIPGFAAAHVPNYGNNQNAYIGVATFGFGQSMVYMITGWFVPVTHIAHNAWIAASELYQIQFGGWFLVGGE